MGRVVELGYRGQAYRLTVGKVDADRYRVALDDRHVAYYPGAFSTASQRILRQLFPDAVLADRADAEAFGLNLVSDGRHVVLNAEAAGMADKVKRTNAEISAMTADGKKVASWSFMGVIPVKWTGPKLAASSRDLAIEELEVCHSGFRSGT